MSAANWWTMRGAAALAAALALAGCSNDSTASTDHAKKLMGNRASVSSSTTVRSVPWFAGGAQLCASAPGPAIVKAMKQSVTRSTKVATYPIAMSSDGSRIYVSTYGRDFSGVAELVVASGKLHPIRAFAHPDRYQAGGSFDGRYLVWSEYHSLYGLDDFTVFSYDTRTARIRRIGQAHTDALGNFYSSPWQYPVANSGYASFAVGFAPRGLTEMVGVNLASGRSKILRRGHAQAPIMIGTTVVWPESASPGVETTLRAVDVRTGMPVKLSPALRAVHGTPVIVGDGTRFAYVDPSRRVLFYSPSPAIPARSVLRLKEDEGFQSVGMATDTLVWITTDATYVADTRTGRYARLETSGNWVASANALSIIEASSGKKTNFPVDPVHILKVADIEFQPCSVSAQ